MWRKKQVLAERSGNGTLGTTHGTLAVSIKSIASENGMIPMNINSDHPTPFETDVSSPQSLLFFAHVILNRILKVTHYSWLELILSLLSMRSFSVTSKMLLSYTTL
jgi:hypothetical protein